MSSTKKSTIFLFFCFFENQSTINLVELFRKPKICKTNVYQSTTLFYFISEKQPIFFYWFVIKCLPNFMYFTVNIVIPTCKSRITNVDDAWKIKVHGKHTTQQHLHNTKRKDLTESTGVVQAEFPLKVKLELLTTLEC